MATRYWEIFKSTGVPTKVDGLTMSSILRSDAEAALVPVLYEEDLREYYKDSAAKYCMPVASSLLFNYKGWNPMLLKWRWSVMN